MSDMAAPLLLIFDFSRSDTIPYVVDLLAQSSTLLFPELPGLLTYLPFACRLAALLLAAPIALCIALDIVAYAIARTLHLSISQQRVPRSPRSIPVGLLSPNFSIGDEDYTNEPCARDRQPFASRQIETASFHDQLLPTPGDSDSDDPQSMAVSRHRKARQSAIMQSTDIRDIASARSIDFAEHAFRVPTASDEVSPGAMPPHTDGAFALSLLACSSTSSIPPPNFHSASTASDHSSSAPISDVSLWSLTTTAGRFEPRSVQGRRGHNLTVSSSYTPGSTFISSKQSPIDDDDNTAPTCAVEQPFEPTSNEPEFPEDARLAYSSPDPSGERSDPSRELSWQFLRSRTHDEA